MAVAAQSRTKISGMHPAELAESDLLEQCEIRFLRRSGPGGQHRNKVETAVQLVHRPSDVAAEANERRSQAANRAAALARLRLNLALRVRGPERSEPSQRWAARVKANRIVVSEEHFDYAVLISELFDCLYSHSFELAEAAAHFNMPSAQLVKLMRKSTQVFQELNRCRQQHGLHPLR